MMHQKFFLLANTIQKLEKKNLMEIIKIKIDHFVQAYN